MNTSLLSLLQKQYSVLIEIDELLLLERQAFTARDSVQIEQINQEKLELLQSITDIDQQLRSQVSSPDVKTIQVQELKAKIDEQLLQLKQRNQVNGKIIAHSQVNLNLLKDLLINGISGDKGQRSLTYDQAGQKSSPLKGRAIKA